MGDDFDGKIAFITGGSDGIGRATAQLLAQRGAHVILCARRPEKLAETATNIRQEGGKVETHALDVGDLEKFEALINDIAQRHGKLDMLVNNAASTHYVPLTKLKNEHWRQDFQVNADAVFTSTRAAMQIMQKQEMGGSIVNVSSSCGLRAPNFMASYSASKAALNHFSACAAMEGAARGVRVNVVAPGQVQTEANQDFARKAPEVAAKTTAAIPMGRGAEPEEIAQAIAFLLSDAASYITGALLPVDGGKVAQLYLPT